MEYHQFYILGEHSKILILFQILMFQW